MSAVEGATVFVAGHNAKRVKALAAEINGKSLSLRRRSAEFSTTTGKRAANIAIDLRGRIFSDCCELFRIARSEEKRQFVTSGGGYEFAVTSI